mmetsp:Transcript_22180/g.51156  ORF Transcript_22180/g.51156 Transcript_22180/m.51156 type:complete len:302 (-) Transcript_22180:1641-2546(-)|eukprot:CAMPEP_0116827494 /NCGR_PEP_ID=MMETSP0418-20121206/3125_1 /TAXON_ID=1158023 /ORGANISM="Astrosyne radiata, Strain 13vi08-1A" /LENGTH=301 /DNA_ID=CAMNT_0004456265 /DNA_START=29 /DNA_END=934 /DNA_ORIENTATION=+
MRNDRLIIAGDRNKAIASSLLLPDTHFLLEYVRPDVLALRVIVRSMILWDEVVPSSAWIEDQIPQVVRKAYQKMRRLACTAAGIPWDENDANDSDAHGFNEGQQQIERDVDRQAVRQMHAFVVAGACFGIGLRFAGTADKDAQSAIRERLLALKAFRDESDPMSIALRPEQSVVEMCLGLCAISLGMVMAGTGDLDTLRVFKFLRWRCTADVRYGSHMAIGAAIGLLFLGGGTCTLGRSNEDIVALVTAFFPRFPSSTSDNQYHLQALRHFYALAVHARLIQAIDIDTGEKVLAEVEVRRR